MAITMDLEESTSDSKLHKDSAAKKVLRPSSAVSLSKSDHGPEQTISNECLKQYKHWVSNERWNELKKIAESAMKERKVFTIKGGGFSAVRQALLDRGWVEKPESHRVRTNLTADTHKLTGNKKDSLSRVERMILFKFMEHHSVDFLWTSKRDKYDWILSNKDVIISRFCRSLFTSKEGLCTSLTQMHWHTEPGVAMTRFPRCYNIHSADQMDEFVDDFRITACIGLLKWLSSALQAGGESELICCTGKVPHSAVEFAISRLTEYIEFFTHNDIDANEDHTQHIWEHEWDQFLTHHYLLVHEKAKFIEEKSQNLRTLEKKGAKILVIMTKYWPQIDIDGILNIWIVKPGNKCRGKGIQLMNNIKDIVGLLNIPSAQKTRYVVQKYIENPLVIYDTKFDIRQWFLITNCQPLTIWMYKDSYLRFSSQMFSLSNYHESVHLTNNAVQTRYKNHGERDKALPDENMWDCHTFKAYLRQIGKSEMWESKIYPGMKQCLVGAMLACQDSMDKRQNSFELYGADFMLAEDFTPWLIEINSSPDLAPTTSVTARLCPQCLEDVVRVVIDRRNNPECDTGTFELAYRQVVPKAPAYLGLSLCINGKKMLKKHKSERRSEHRGAALLPRAAPPEPERDSDQPVPPSYSGPIITDFLAWLHPYAGLPCDKDGLVAPPDRLAVRHALTVVKSGLLHKGEAKTKRKSSAVSSRSRARRGAKRCTVSPHSCSRLDARNQSGKSAPGELGAEPALSVGNKRCYIDPLVWERGTASILRSTLAVQHRVAARCEPLAPLPRRAPRTQPDARGSSDGDKISAVGRNIGKLRAETLASKENYSNDKINSLYGPYRMTLSPTVDVIKSKNK